ncbi:putative bifunctional diguanylate cyclase/phosphodiesterase [Treponema brennaborense]|uniref:Diguanylate cyclase/phosphodiesterase n=1 Tax=Treponema brennaborense (strain DSM 12168 / CIP 105900 / DD5/3) TaxID=906968 RepID=F4LPU5_TREBD|nr:bifunctional diguanylate cyclase/phosphodiesterase [Treponema brennaborense]AEE16037.1 diguanylate cyclase/phosphodiesterase [Treponema brennaborense DSM 12168]
MSDKLIFKSVESYKPNLIVVAKPVCDTTGKPVDFHITDTNRFGAELIGCVTQLEGLPLSVFFTNISDAGIGTELIRQALQNDPETQLVFFSHKLQLWLRVMTEMMTDGNLMATILDVTNDKLREEQLKQQNDRLAALTDELEQSRQVLRYKLNKIEALNMELSHIAYHDMLTGLKNRSCFNKDINLLTTQISTAVKIFGIMIIDIDNMKNINDSRGHTAGDMLLCNAANALRQFKKDTIQLYRFGGDEFLVLATELETRDSMITVSDVIMEAFETAEISISAGITLYPDDSILPDQLLKFADMALHEVKKQGKHNSLFFSRSMQDEFLNRLNIETKLQKAINGQSFEMYFQPQVDISRNKLRGFEALIRWYDPELGWIPPSKFIPIAEETRQVIALGEWVLETACRTLKRWQEEYRFTGIISVNISPVQLKKASFIYDLEQLIAEQDIDPTKLEIEITEGVFIENMESVVSILTQIKSMGIGISLDDFGTGYSSFNYLQILPLTALKIDKSFISNIAARNSVEADITDAIVALVTKLGLDTIAEGVETVEQLQVLQSINCRTTQGFLTGKPMPISLCEKMLSGDESAILRIETENRQPIRYSI